jgi:drug/metabolite transporter (DMT)-like permease
MDPSTSGASLVRGALAMTGVGTLTAVSATLTHYPLYGGQAVRYAVAATILLVIARARHRDEERVAMSRRDLLLIVALAMTGLAGFNVCIVMAARDTSPATIGTVVGSVPIVLAVGGPLLAGRRPAAWLIAAALVVTAGAGLVCGFAGGRPAGLALSFGALCGEACFSLLAVPLLPRLGPIRISAYSTAAAVPVLLVIGILTEGGGMLRWPSAGQALALAYLSVVVTVGAFLLWYSAVGRVGAERAGLCAGFVPLSALLTSAALGVAHPGLIQVAGAVLVGAGVVIGSRTSR